MTMAYTLKHIVARILPTTKKCRNLHRIQTIVFFQKKEMEIEQDVPVPSIKIPLSVSDECIELFVDELDDDTTDIISLLFGECVPPKYWIQIAVTI